MIMNFDYNKCIWGKNTATLKFSDPSSIRLKRIIKMAADLPAGSKILEVGCGGGAFIRAISILRPDLHCYGCDISSTAIKQAQDIDITGSIDYTVCEGKTLPYNENIFDAVYIIDVLEHVLEPENLLKEIHRIIKPRGLFFSFVPCENDRTSFWKYLDMFGLKKDVTKKHAGHINFFSKKELLDLYARIKFNIKKISYSEHFFGQIIGVFSFVAMDKYAKKNNLSQVNNEIFFETINSKKKGWRNLFRMLVNLLIYFESTIFYCIPSPNIFIIAIK